MSHDERLVRSFTGRGKFTRGWACLALLCHFLIFVQYEVDSSLWCDFKYVLHTCTAITRQQCASWCFITISLRNKRRIVAHSVCPSILLTVCDVRTTRNRCHCVSTESYHSIRWISVQHIPTNHQRMQNEFVFKLLYSVSWLYFTITMLFSLYIWCKK